MIHDEICTFEVCELAKEKGFNVPTDRYYHIYDDVIEAQNSLEMTGDGCSDFYNSLNQCRCAAPTQSLLQRWLRKEKFIDIEIYPIFINGVKVYTCCIYAPNLNKPKKCNYFDTYELALEDAIKYALENLI